MANPIQPEITLSKTDDYRSSYANSVQVHMSVWDFLLIFGTFQQQPNEASVEIKNFQAINMSPQTAKALSRILAQNVAEYERAFGEVNLDPNMQIPGSTQMN